MPTPPAERPELRVSSEYRAWPLWVVHDDGALDNPSPADFGLPADLARSLVDWADDFDAIYPPDDPGSAAFSSSEAKRDFYARGRVLAERVAAVVGDHYRVVYRDRSGPGQVEIS